MGHFLTFGQYWTVAPFQRDLGSEHVPTIMVSIVAGKEDAILNQRRTLHIGILCTKHASSEWK